MIFTNGLIQEVMTGYIADEIGSTYDLCPKGMTDEEDDEFQKELSERTVDKIIDFANGVLTDNHNWMLDEIKDKAIEIHEQEVSALYRWQDCSSCSSCEYYYDTCRTKH